MKLFSTVSSLLLATAATAFLHGGHLIRTRAPIAAAPIARSRAPSVVAQLRTTTRRQLRGDSAGKPPADLANRKVGIERVKRAGRQAGRTAGLWLPFFLTTGLGAAALVGIGATGVGGMTVAQGVTMAKLSVGATVANTGFSAFRFGLFGGDGERVARLMGGVPAEPRSRAAKAVEHVAKVLASSDARDELDSDDGVAQRLAARPPRAFVLTTKEPNAFAAGSGDGTVVAVSEGLLALMNEEELQAVVAHELGHVRHADVGHHMQQAAMAAGFAGAMDLGLRMLNTRGGKDKDDDESSSLAPGLALVGVGALQYAAGTLTRLAASRGDEFAADAVAARLPRGAPALASALRKLEVAAESGVKRDALGEQSGALASCYIVNEAAHDRPSSWSDWLRTHPTIDRRIARLEACRDC